MKQVTVIVAVIKAGKQAVNPIAGHQDVPNQLVKLCTLC
jgi:hypothetical protein